MATDIARGMVYLHAREYYDDDTGRLQRCIMHRCATLSLLEPDISSSSLLGRGRSHAPPRLHRDLKPENVLVTEFMSGKISDFGTSRTKDARDAEMTASVGTPVFVAPEVGPLCLRIFEI